MKILFVVGQFPCLSETFVLNQVTGLLDLGHDVRVVSLGKFESKVLHEGYVKYNLQERVLWPIRTMPHNKFKRLAYLTKLVFDLYKKIGINVLELLNVFLYKKLAYTGLLIHASENMVQTGWSPDVVVAHFADMGVYVAAYQNCGLLNAPAVVFVHAHEIAAKSADRINKEYKALFENKKITILPISNFWYDKLKESGANCSRMQVFRMGVELNDFNPVEKTECRSQNQFKVVSVGRLVGQKGYPYSLSAIKLCHEKGIPVQYYIVGEGELRNSIETFIEIENAADYIHLLGAKSKDNVIEIMQDADLFLLPSVTDDRGLMEGIPVALMEAMAMKIPVVSTFHSGIPELIEDNCSGWLCHEKNAEEIAEKIIDAYNNPKKTKAFADNARKKIEKEYDIAVLMGNLEQLLKKICGNKE